MKTPLAEIIARALHDAGVKVATYVPGHGATQVFSAYCRVSGREHPVSFHEEIAYTIAHGASLVGARAVSLMKAHGFSKAGNSVLDSLYAGTTAGFVTIIFDDKTGTHSDSILNLGAYLDGCGIPHRSGTGERIYQEVIDCFELSERYQLPCALVVDADALDQLAPCESTPVPPVRLSYRREIRQHVLCPFFSAYQRAVLDAKRGGADWKRIPKPPLPQLPDDVPRDWKSLVDSYAPLFTVFQPFRGELVAGDTGVSSLFAFPPYHCIDVTTYMGGSIPLALGAHLAGYRAVWAVTGDFSFIAAGHLALLEAVQRRIPLKVLVIYNGQSATTGGQRIPGGTLERTLAGSTEYVRWITNPVDTREIEQVLREATNANEMRILVADYRTVYRKKGQRGLIR
jgi:TPP-dependent indolepyruvate ferredoxin oxidoreductase alpha subunit